MTRKTLAALALIAGGGAIYLALGAHLLQRPASGKWALLDGPPPALAKLDRLLAPLAPRLPLSDLVCGAQPLDQPLLLTPAAPSCHIQIDTAPPGDFWRMGLVVSALNPVKPALYIRADYDAATLAEGKQPADCVPLTAAETMPALWLGVEFTPASAGAVAHSCWLPAHDPRRLELTLMEPASITLSCHGCTESTHQLTLKFR